jgi:hypothetical protein
MFRTHEDAINRGVRRRAPGRLRVLLRVEPAAPNPLFARGAVVSRALGDALELGQALRLAAPQVRPAAV